MQASRSYLDHNAGSPLRPEVVDAMVAALRLGGNPSSVHAEGRRARALVENARADVAALVGSAPDRVVFTSGGTEANNLALEAATATGLRIVASPVEHAAVLTPAGGAARRSTRVDERGVIDLAHLDDELARGGPALVALQLANNETGVIQPLADAATLVRRAGGLVHADTVQAAGRIVVDVAALAVDTIALSAHKLGGPAGVGALVLRDGYDHPARLVRGGGQERGRRGGTENLAGIVGFGVAASLAARALADEAIRLGAMRDRAEAAIRRVAPDVAVFGEGAPRLPNTLCFAVTGLRADTALISLDLDGIAASSGAACSSGAVRRSPVLAAMGVDPALAECALRVSFGWNSTDADVERLVGSVEKVVARLYRLTTGRAA